MRYQLTGLAHRFGKAFCNALSSTVCTTQPCTNCPSHSTSRKIPTPPPEATDEEAALFESLTDLPCCGDPTLCGSLTCKPNKEGDASVVKVERAVVKAKPSSPSPSTDVETVPCNEAWTALKQHPNIAFAGAALLSLVLSLSLSLINTHLSSTWQTCKCSPTLSPSAPTAAARS